jgi:methyl-accepting chemotaxis protein
MAGVISDVTRRGRLLAESASAASGALAEVKHTIGRVLETAQGAAALAEQAGMDTERGSLVLSESLDGIEHIRQASRAIGAVTDDLQRRVAEIGDILHLIAELTQRTNLLALNASIIAAQAGVEGRGFAVVADEIKDLARRTAESAGSIDSLIQALAEGAHAARRAAMAGGEAVEAGAARARDAARAMSDILTRLRSWTVMARSIATATEEQARAAAQATRAVQEVQGMAAEIVGRAVDQSRRTEHVQRQAARLQELTAMLLQSAQEERDGAAQAADTLARLLRTIEELGGAGRGRVGESERLAGLLQHVRRVALGQRDAAATLLRTATALRAQAEALAEELAPLKK